LAVIVWTPVAGQAQQVDAVVERVVDGDSLRVRFDGRDEPVRLIGVDAPELSHPDRPVEFLAVEATRLVRQLTAGGHVRLVADSMTGDRDDYGRLLRYVYLDDGRLLNAELIRAGHAYAFTRHPFEQEQRFLALEEQARRSGLGIWADGGLAELVWVLEQGRPPFRIWPTSNRDWAVAYGGLVRVHVRTSELIPLLIRLVRWTRELEPGSVEPRLEEEGFAPLRRNGAVDGPGE
jgi:micrococcal nuclease